MKRKTKNEIIKEISVHIYIKQNTTKTKGKEL